MSDSTKPDENRARFVVLLGSTKRVKVPYSGPYSRCSWQCQWSFLFESEKRGAMPSRWEA